MSIWLKQTQKRIIYLGAILTIIFFYIKGTIWPEFSCVFCIIPLEVSVLIVPVYTYFKMESDCKTLNEYTAKFLMFCSANFAVFFYIFIISAALRTDGFIVVSWYSIFITIYYNFFIYFLVVCFLVPGFVRSGMKTQASVAVFWGIALLVVCCLLPEYLESEEEYSLWLLLLPVLVVAKYCLLLGLFKLLFFKEKISREIVFYLFCFVFVMLVIVKIWIAAYAIGIAFLTVDWVLTEVESIK